MTESMTCRDCGKIEAVHPDLPPDYKPNLCGECSHRSAARTYGVIQMLADGLNEFTGAPKGKPN